MKSAVFRCLVLLGVWICALSGCPAQETSGLPAGTRVLRDLAYVERGHANQRLDLYLPARGQNWPLVIWIHGGGWENGNRDRPKPLGMLWNGCALASIEYRFSQHAPFPAQIEDCLSAVRWLRVNAKQYGYNPEKFAVWGQSAGGHLAALVGTASDVPQFAVGPYRETSARVQAVVDFCGPSDLTLYGASQPGDTLSKLLGGPLQERGQVARLANPISYIGPDTPPFLIAHGDDDPTVPIAHSRRLEAALREASIPVRLIVTSRTGHNPTTTETMSAAQDFLITHLQPNDTAQERPSTKRKSARRKGAASSSPATPAPAVAESGLNQNWTVEKYVRSGTEDPTLRGSSRSSSSDRFVFVTPNGYRIEGPQTVRDEITPPQVDTRPESGPYQNKDLLGIYELKGNRLVIAFAEPGHPRPDGFMPKAGVVVITFRSTDTAADKGKERSDK